MKYAKSISKGGLLVSAEDCTHLDFEILKPVCPFCGEGVYHRSATTRSPKRGSARKKEIQIPAHWCHFRKDGNSSNGADCENRAKSNSSQGLYNQIKRKAKNQRYKILTDGFLKLLRSTPDIWKGIDEADNIENMGLVELDTAVGALLSASRAYMLALTEPLLTGDTQIPQDFMESLEPVKDDHLNLGYGLERLIRISVLKKLEEVEKATSEVEDLGIESYAFARNAPVLRTQNHVDVCLEIFNFLAVKRHRPLLNLLSDFCVFRVITMEFESLGEFESSADLLDNKKDRLRLIETLRNAAFYQFQSRVAITPWLNLMFPEEA